MNPDVTEAIAFYLLAAVTLISAFGAVAMNNLARGSFLLVLTFSGVAGLYFLLNAEFIAAAQILIYSGAIAILVIFALMLTQRATAIVQYSLLKRYLSGLFALSCFGILAWVLTGVQWFAGRGQMPQDTTYHLGRSLLSTYLIPLEVAGFILLAAIIGAVALAKKEDLTS